MSDSDKRSILLIDDDPSLLTTLSDFLSFEGYDVTTADSGEQGLKRLETLTPHLIVLDMSMPGMGGVGFLREISDSNGDPSYPVLVLTARANMAEFFANVNVDGFVAKPCDPNDLLMEVARIIFLRSGEQSPSPSGGSVTRRVLLGEDDPMLRKHLARVLQAAGFEIQAVERGPDVMEQAIVMRPDAIVLKHVLPGMNGSKVIEMLRMMPNTSDVPALVYDDSGASLRMAPEAAATLSENDPNAILAALKRLLGD